MPESHSITDFGFRVLTLKSPVGTVHGQRLFENTGANRHARWHGDDHRDGEGAKLVWVLTTSPFSNNRCTSRDARSSMSPRPSTRPRRLRPQNDPTAPNPEHGSNPNFPGPQHRSPPAHAPAAARQAPESAHCAAALQRCPMQNPQQKTLRRALQGAPEECDHSEMAGRNRPGFQPEAGWLPGSGTIVGRHRRTAPPARPAPPRPGPKLRPEGRRVDTNNARGGTLGAERTLHDIVHRAGTSSHPAAAGTLSCRLFGRGSRNTSFENRGPPDTAILGGTPTHPKIRGDPHTQPGTPRHHPGSPGT